MYDRIFFTNVLRLLKDRGMTKTELHSMSGVSASIISDITRGHGNPTLETMEAIANALDTPLPEMFLHIDPELVSVLQEASPDRINADLPDGYEKVIAVLPAQKAFIVKKWVAEDKRKSRK